MDQQVEEIVQDDGSDWYYSVAAYPDRKVYGPLPLGKIKERYVENATNEQAHRLVWTAVWRGEPPLLYSVRLADHLDDLFGLRGPEDDEDEDNESQRVRIGALQVEGSSPNQFEWKDFGPRHDDWWLEDGPEEPAEGNWQDFARFLNRFEHSQYFSPSKYPASVASMGNWLNSVTYLPNTDFLVARELIRCAVELSRSGEMEGIVVYLKMQARLTSRQAAVAFLRRMRMIDRLMRTAKVLCPTLGGIYCRDLVGSMADFLFQILESPEEHNWSRESTVPVLNEWIKHFPKVRQDICSPNDLVKLRATARWIAGDHRGAVSDAYRCYKDDPDEWRLDGEGFLCEMYCGNLATPEDTDSEAIRRAMSSILKHEPENSFARVIRAAMYYQLGYRTDLLFRELCEVIDRGHDDLVYGFFAFDERSEGDFKRFLEELIKGASVERRPSAATVRRVDLMNLTFLPYLSCGKDGKVRIWDVSPLKSEPHTPITEDSP
jgi:hypothetical protein